MSFYRKLSPLEVTYLADDYPDYSMLVNQFILEGSGDIDIKHFKESVARASEVNPGCRLVLKGYWKWRYWDDAGPLPSVDVIESDWDGESSEGAPVLGNPINPRKGPNTQITIVKGEITRLIFRTHHATMDGMGMLAYAVDIFRALRGEPLQGTDGRKTDWDVVQAVNHPKPSIVKGNSIPVTKVASNPDDSGCRWYRLRWQGKYTKIAAKMTLAACRIAWRNNGTDKRIIMRIPSDLRRYLAEEDGINLGNLTGAIDIEIPPDATVNSIQSSIIKQMRSKEDLSVFPDNSAIAFWMPKRVFRNNPRINKLLHEKGTYPMTGTVTYLGNVDPSQYDFGDFKAISTYGVPIPYETKPIFIGFNVNPDGLNAVVGVPKALATHEELIQLCDELKTELDAF